MARNIGTFNFPANFEVTKLGPIDARSQTGLKSELTDSSLPFAYLGMLVSVTDDTAENNGLYMLTSADATQPASWSKIDSSGAGVQSVAYDQASGRLTITLADANNTGNQNGGDFNSGDWRTRILDTEITDSDGIVSLSSNQFTLQAGNYFIVAWASALQVNGHQARLRDITNSATRAHGSSEYSSNNYYVTSKSWIFTRVTPSSATAYELQHRCQTSVSGVGFGNGSGDQWTQEANGDTYCMVIIFKEN